MDIQVADVARSEVLKPQDDVYAVAILTAKPTKRVGTCYETASQQNC